jgi:hypothetical protein
MPEQNVVTGNWRHKRLFSRVSEDLLCFLQLRCARPDRQIASNQRFDQVARIEASHLVVAQALHVDWSERNT